MPQEPDCRSGAWSEDSDPEQPWLEVRKQRFESPPVPPAAVKGWVDPKDLTTATPEMPPLREFILIEGPGSGAEEEPAIQLTELHLSECPDVVAAYEGFRPTWEDWSAHRRRQEAIQRVYAELFRLDTQLKKQGEILELVIGIGLIDWRATVGQHSIPLKRHAIIGQVDLEFDPGEGVIRLTAPGDGARLRIEDDMLEPELRPERRHYDIVQGHLDAAGDAIWDRDLIYTALKTWAEALDANSVWFPGLRGIRAEGDSPSISFAPALLLRKRPQTGMLRIYENLIEQLGSDDLEVPEGWRRLVDDTWTEREVRGARSAASGDRERGGEKTQEVYFPLPANREQRRIVEALDRNQGVLVQGPPGTGKSHTIANLICHLLATGKRVLITAETGRALQVLKEKLPSQIRPLCVSLLGQGGDAFAELNAAVQEITNRFSTYSLASHEERISAGEEDLGEARRALAKIDAEMRSLREDETISHSLCGGVYKGTASQIAERVAKETKRFGWLRPAEPFDETSPLSNHEAKEWLAICRRYGQEAIEASTRRIPESVALTSPTDFAQYVGEEKQARARSEADAGLDRHPASPSLRALRADERLVLKEALNRIRTDRKGLQRLTYDWLPGALRAMIAGRDDAWRTLRKHSVEGLEKASRLSDRVGASTVSWPTGIDRRSLRTDAAAALTHLKSGGKWKRLGFLTPRAMRGKTYLAKDVLIDGQPASTISGLACLCDYLDRDFVLGELWQIWKAAGANDLPRDPRLFFADLTSRVAHLDDALRYAASCSDAAGRLAECSPPCPSPDWLGEDVDTFWPSSKPQIAITS